jgi:hypothetical protein
MYFGPLRNGCDVFFTFSLMTIDPAPISTSFNSMKMYFNEIYLFQNSPVQPLVKSQPQPYCADAYFIKKTLSAIPRPLYCWKAESHSFLTVLRFGGGQYWHFIKQKVSKFKLCLVV